MKKGLDRQAAELAAVMKDNQQLRKKLREQSLENGLFLAMQEELQGNIVAVDPLPPAFKPKAKAVTESLVMHVSDAHADETVHGKRVGGFEEFTFDTALCRAEEYVETVLKYTQETLTGHTFDDLWFLMYGDMSSGEIHGASDRSYYKIQMLNCMAIARMVSLMIRDLAPVFPKVHVVCLSGNHGRRSIKKDYEGALNNWDALISFMARDYCAKLKNVDFVIPDSWSTVVNIKGYNFHVAHGDDIKSWNSIPFYGIERATRRLTALHHSAGQKVNYYVLGHHHTCSSMADLKGETFINGAWAATNPYSFNAFAGYREPMQLLHGVHAEKGVTWRLPVKLKNEKREAKGPSRYIGAKLETGAFE